MEMQQIRYFLALCEDHNFTRAAERCGVSQPSLTRAIKQLETELGGPLFERSRTASRLSCLGMAVRPHLAAVDQAAGDANVRRRPSWPPVKSYLSSQRRMPCAKSSTLRRLQLFLLLAVGLTIRPPQPADASSPTKRASQGRLRDRSDDGCHGDAAARHPVRGRRVSDRAAGNAGLIRPLLESWTDNTAKPWSLSPRPGLLLSASIGGLIQFKRTVRCRLLDRGRHRSARLYVLF